MPKYGSNVRFDTQVIKADTPENISRAAHLAAQLLGQGQVVGMPTETVYGLAANAFDDSAVEKIFLAKGRPQDNPLIVHISDKDMLEELTAECGDVRRQLIDSFWPGPLTVIFPKSGRVSLKVTAGLDTVAVRMPVHPVALAMISEAGFPLAAPSANLSGLPSTTCAQHVLNDLSGKIPLIVDGGECSVGLESTVVAVKENTITVLRPGGVTAEMLKKAVPWAEVKVAGAVFKPLKEGESAPSPGMKHKHYSPKAKVILCTGKPERIVDFANGYEGKNAVFIGSREMCGGVAIDSMEYESSPEDEARHIFSYLRRADELGYAFVVVTESENTGMGMAINNRLLRAAGFEVVEL